MKVHPLNTSQLLTSQPRKKAQNMTESRELLNLNENITQRKQEQLDASDDYQKADMQKALEFKSVHQIVDSNGQQYPILVDNEELAKYGVGVYLFFEFLKYLTITFLIMGLAVIPALYSNLSSDGLDGTASASNYLIKTTVANQNQFIFTSYINNGNGTKFRNIMPSGTNIDNMNIANFDKYKALMKDKQQYIIWSDYATCFIFLIFLLFWRWKSNQITKKQENQIQPNLYAIQIQGLSRDLKDPNIIKNHFEKHFNTKISQVSMIKDYFGTLFEYKELAEYYKQIQIEKKRNEQKGQKSSKLLEEIYEKYKKKQQDVEKITRDKAGIIQSNDDFPTLSAIVVFSDQQARKTVLETYKKSNRICADKYDSMLIEEKKFQIIKNVEQPSNIKWENLDVGSFSIFLRGTCVLLIILFVMLATFLVIFFANIAKKNDDGIACPITEYTYQEAVTAKNESVTQCYCQAKDYRTLASDDVIQNFCWDFYQNYLTQIIFQICIAFIIAFQNIIFQIILRALSKYLQWKTVTEENQGLTFSIFIAMFINTAILTVILSAEIYGAIPAVQISQPIPPLKDLQEENISSFQTDFNRDWYTQIGNKIVSPHIVGLLLAPLFKFLRDRKVKSAVIQLELNENIIGSEFQFVKYQSTVLSVCFSTYLYSSGLPIMIWIGFVSLSVRYITFKYMLLRFNRIPVAYDQKINDLVRNILPWCLVFHMAVSIYLHGSSTIFPLSENKLSSIIVSNAENYSQGLTITDSAPVEDIKLRALNQIYFSIVLAIVVFFIILNMTVGNILGVFFSICLQTEEIKIEKTWEQQKEQFPQILFSYDISDNNDYKSLIHQMTLNDHQRTEFASHILED